MPVLTEKEIIHIMREQYGSKLKDAQQDEISKLKQELDVYLKQRNNTHTQHKKPVLTKGLRLRNSKTDVHLYPVIDVIYTVQAVNAHHTTLKSPENKILVIKNEKITSDFKID